MIRIHIPGLIASDFGKNETRKGDATIITGTETLVIDGYCGSPSTRLIKRLKDRGIKSPYLALSHPHYDHYYGIRKIINDTYFAPKALYCHDPASLKGHDSDISTNIRVLKSIISEAQKRKIPVHYLDDGDDVEIGDIKFTVYREYASYTGNSDAYLNNNSLCFWFPELRYLTTGDAGLGCAKEHNLRPVLIKGGHHGNNCVRSISTWLKDHGCKYYWDNDYSVNLTSFLMTGREDAIAVGMQVFSIHGDINVCAYGGKAVIYKNGTNYQYKCTYKGKTEMRMADLDAVTDTVEGKYGNGDNRVTSLIDAGYYPSNVQNRINRILKAMGG